MSVCVELFPFNSRPETSGSPDQWEGLARTSGDWAPGCPVDVPGDRAADISTSHWLIQAWAPRGRSRGAFSCTEGAPLVLSVLPDCEYEL